MQVKVVGERAPLLRVPATGDERTLPPANWEKALLAVDRVLVALVVRQALGPHGAPSLGVVRGDLPVPKADNLELLRLEYVLPPATKQVAAEKAMQKALRKVAGEMGLPLPPGKQMLRQVVVQHGSVLAILAVPKAQAVEWLRGSGCAGLYLRPFWTDRTDASVGRSRFSLLWLKGKAERGPEIWQAFRNKLGVFGLLLAGRDVALRVDQAADLQELQAQLTVLSGDKFRQAAKGQRWWRLGPLTEAESWQALEMVKATGLEPLRGELRHARMGRWRHAVFFAAVGVPSRTSFDDGSRNSSEAYLVEAAPPPRQSATSVVAVPKMQGGVALAESSSWAGPRRSPQQQLQHPPDTLQHQQPQRPSQRQPTSSAPRPAANKQLGRLQLQESRGRTSKHTLCCPLQ